MGYSFTEKKRIRKSFSKRSEVDQIPNLLEIQKESYRKLLQKGVPSEQRIDQGLQAAFKSVFPIESYRGAASLDFATYKLGQPAFDVRECRQRGLMYSAPLHAILRLPFIMVKKYARRTMHLGNNNSFRTVDDERSVFGHQRNFAHIHFLLLHISDRLCRTRL